MPSKAFISLKQKIYTQLRQEIISGRIAPGERVKEAWLTEKYSCSRGPVREALNLLEKEGFLELVPNQGAVVTKFSPDEVEDFYALLELLEGKAVEWATPYLEQKDIRKLEEINNALKGIASKGRPGIEEWVSLNLAFHRLFREKCGNRKMNWIVDEIRLRITRYRYLSLMMTAFDNYLEDHDMILEAVRQGNPLQAAEAMENHIRRAKKVLMEYLSSLPSL